MGVCEDEEIVQRERYCVGMTGFMAGYIVGITSFLLQYDIET